MRIAIQRPSSKGARNSSRANAQRSDAAAFPGPPAPTTAPPADLLALQRLIQREHGSSSNSSSSSSDTPAAPAPEAELSERIRTASGGQPLDSAARDFLEPRFGTDLSGVRVHAGTEAHSLAREVQATAFTTGSNIFFGQGAYRPGTADGKRLLAHETAHVIQQASGPVDGTPAAGGISVSDPSDRFEREADSIADQVVSGKPVDEKNKQGATAGAGVAGVAVQPTRFIQRAGPQPVAPPGEDWEKYKKEQDEQKQRGAVSEAQRSALWDLIGLGSKGGIASLGIDMGKMVYHGVKGENGAAAEDAASSMVDAVGLIPYVGKAVGIGAAGFDTMQGDKRAKGASAASAPTAGNALMNAIIDLVSYGADPEPQSWDVHEAAKKQAAAQGAGGASAGSAPKALPPPAAAEKETPSWLSEQSQKLKEEEAAKEQAAREAQDDELRRRWEEQQKK